MKLLLLVAAVAGIWWWLRRGRSASPRRAPTLSRAEAYDLLDLPEGAPADQVRAAHRRLMQRLHPDNGGSSALAAQVNAARDRLLARD